MRARITIFEYDALRRRLWILGQRCHHGAGGTLVTAAAFLGLAIERQASPALTGLVAAGGLLMAHDWPDRSIWFERGYGSQP